MNLDIAQANPSLPVIVVGILYFAGVPLGVLLSISANLLVRHLPKRWFLALVLVAVLVPVSGIVPVELWAIRDRGIRPVVATTQRDQMNTYRGMTLTTMLFSAVALYRRHRIGVDGPPRPSDL